MARQSEEERERTAKRSKAASQALKGRLGKPAPGVGPKKVQRPAVPRTYTPNDVLDEYGTPLSGVELFKQHFARNQELGLGDGRGNVHTDELQLPRGAPDETTQEEVVAGLPKTKPIYPQRPAPKPAPAAAARPRAVQMQPPAQQRQPAPAPVGRPRMVQMGEEQPQQPQAQRPNAPRQAAPQGGRPDMSVQARIARKNQIQQQITQRKIDELVRDGFRPEDAAQMVNPDDVNEAAHRGLVHNEVEDGIQAARAEHDAMQQAARSAPRQPTQEENDDDRMAREWRDLQTRGKGVHAQNEREANESSNAGALAALDARENRRDTRFEDRMARTIAFDKAEKAKRDAARAAEQAADPEGFAVKDAARKQQLREGLQRRKNEASVAQMVRTYGEDHLNKNGFGPNQRLKAKQSPQLAGSMRANLYNKSMGNSAQQVAARNSQRARRDARMRGLGPEIAEDTMVAAGDDPNRQAVGFGAAGRPDLGANVIANNIAAKANQPPAPAQPDMKSELDAIYGPDGLINYIRTTMHPSMQEGALRSLLTDHGMDAAQVEHAVGALRGPKPGLIQRGFNALFGAPVEPPPPPPAQPAPNKVGAATGFLDPRSVARGMQGPRMLRGLV